MLEKSRALLMDKTLVHIGTDETRATSERVPSGWNASSHADLSQGGQVED